MSQEKCGRRPKPSGRATTRCPLRSARDGVAIGLAVLLSTMVSCAGSAPPPGPRIAAEADALAADAPEWVRRGCRAYWHDAEIRRQVVCGVGSAPAHRDRVRARETAIARARSEIARSLEVTIESLVRLEDRGRGPGRGEGELTTIVHQLSSTSLRGARVETVWRAASGAVHALVSLDLERLQSTVRATRALPPTTRQSVAERAADAFAELDARFESAADEHRR